MVEFYLLKNLAWRGLLSRGDGHAMYKFEMMWGGIFRTKPSSRHGALGIIVSRPYEFGEFQHPRGVFCGSVSDVMTCNVGRTPTSKAKP